jgi:hypothetical protein
MDVPAYPGNAHTPGRAPMIDPTTCFDCVCRDRAVVDDVEGRPLPAAFRRCGIHSLVPRASLGPSLTLRRPRRRPPSESVVAWDGSADGFAAAWPSTPVPPRRSPVCARSVMGGSDWLLAGTTEPLRRATLAPAVDVELLLVVSSVCTEASVKSLPASGPSRSEMSA